MRESAAGNLELADSRVRVEAPFGARVGREDDDGEGRHGGRRASWWRGAVCF